MGFKPLLSIGVGATVISGGVATGIYLSRDNSINKQLIEENKKILSIEATDILWEIKLNNYTQTEKTKHNLNLPKDDIANLRIWCANTLKSTFNNKEDKNYQSSKELCTVPSNREKLLKKGNKLAESSDWEAKKTAYNQSSNNQTITTITKGSAQNGDIERWCKEAWDKEYTSESESNYTLVLKWCTKEGQ